MQRLSELEQLERQRAEISARIDEIHRIKADRGKQKAKPSAHSGGYGSKPAKAGGAGGQYQGAPSKPPAKLGRPAKNGGAGGGAGGPGKPKKQNGGRRPSDVRDYGDSDGEEVMLQVPTLAQKQELADKIADAEPDVLMQALDLIQKTTQLGNVSGNNQTRRPVSMLADSLSSCFERSTTMRSSSTSTPCPPTRSRNCTILLSRASSLVKRCRRRKRLDPSLAVRMDTISTVNRDRRGDPRRPAWEEGEQVALRAKPSSRRSGSKSWRPS